LNLIPVLNVSFPNIIVKSTPTLRQLCNHITPQYVHYWREIGILLGISNEILDEIKTHHHSEQTTCIEAVFEKWLEMDPSASWEKVFKAIDASGLLPYAGNNVFNGYCTICTT